MIQPLRKWHRRMAFNLAVLLPILFFAGLHVRHAWPGKKLVTSTKSAGTRTSPESQNTQAAQRGVGQ